LCIETIKFVVVTLHNELFDWFQFQNGNELETIQQYVRIWSN
jgi:hypothetical protein